MEVEHTLQQQQCDELHHDPDSSDKIELQPVDEDVASASPASSVSRNLLDFEWLKQRLRCHWEILSSR
jgi:hypothetical protein